MYQSASFSSSFLCLFVLCFSSVSSQSCKTRIYQVASETKDMVKTMSDSVSLMSSHQEALAYKVDKIRTDLSNNMARVDEIVKRMDQMVDTFDSNVKNFARMQASTDEQLRKMANILQFWYDVTKNMDNSTRRNDSSIKIEDLRKVVVEELDLLRNVIEKNVKQEAARSVKEINSQVDNVITMVGDLQERTRSAPGQVVSEGSGLGKIENMIKFRFGEMKHLIEDVRGECKNLNANSSLLYRSSSLGSERLPKTLNPINHTASYVPCRNINPSSHTNKPSCSKDHNAIGPKSCAEVFHANGTCSGSYPLWIGSNVRAYCDMEDGGGWTVILRRGKFSGKTKRYDFRHEWKAYKQGFGDAMDELWLGNEKVHRLTSTEAQVLRVELFAYGGRCSTLYYSNFKVLSEAENYRLIVGQPINCDLHIANLLLSYNNTDFVTSDRYDDHRLRLCHLDRSKIGWWMNAERCNEIHLTGPFREEMDEMMERNEEGITWYSFEANKSLKSVQLSIRPAAFVSRME